MASEEWQAFGGRPGPNLLTCCVIAAICLAGLMFFVFDVRLW
jgi:hypothetical protein